MIDIMIYHDISWYIMMYHDVIMDKWNHDFIIQNDCWSFWDSLLWTITVDLMSSFTEIVLRIYFYVWSVWIKRRQLNPTHYQGMNLVDLWNNFELSFSTMLKNLVILSCEFQRSWNCRDFEFASEFQPSSTKFWP